VIQQANMHDSAAASTCMVLGRQQLTIQLVENKLTAAAATAIG
jgi:hypothetical protein